MDILILGAGYAGLACALRLANRARGRATITLVNASESFVDRIRLHQVAAGQAMPTRQLRTMLRGSDVRLKLGRVRAIDPTGSVLIDNERLRFDRLVIALGSHTDIDAIPGIREYAFTLDGGSTKRLAEALSPMANSEARISLIGGGLSGIEAAAEIKESYPRLRVSLLTSRMLGEGLSEVGRRHLQSALSRIGVSVEENAKVRKITKNAVELDERSIESELCVFAGGFVAPAVLRESGVLVDHRGRALVDGFLRAIGHPNIYVIGDAAVMDAPPYPMTMGCKVALPMGIHVAENLARSLRGKGEEPFDYADVIYCISLGRREGLVQPMRANGTPAGWIIKGRPGAFIKEGICKSVLWAIEAERRGWAFYAWRRTGRALLEAASNEKALPA